MPRGDNSFILTDNYIVSSIDVANRKFSIRVMRFENGAFVSITEDESARIGPMVVSLYSTGTPISTSVIPDKTDTFFLKLVAEMVSSRTRGIATVTSSIKTKVPTDITRTIISKVIEMVS